MYQCHFVLLCNAHLLMAQKWKGMTSVIDRVIVSLSARSRDSAAACPSVDVLITGLCSVGKRTGESGWQGGGTRIPAASQLLDVAKLKRCNYLCIIGSHTFIYTNYIYNDLVCKLVVSNPWRAKIKSKKNNYGVV